MYAFARDVVPGLGRFVLNGPSDYHHLSRLFVRRFTRSTTVAVVVFDDRSDCSGRREWSSRGWARALARDPGVLQVLILGCCGSRRPLPPRPRLQERLEVIPWRQVESHWEERVAGWADALAADDVYVSVDLPGAAAGSGCDGASVARAVEIIRERRRLLGGDVCASAHAAAAWAALAE
jgi:hypothetical protein